MNGNTQLEELAAKYPTQICVIALLNFWTKEVEMSISELKVDRKAINSGSKKISQLGAKLLMLLSKPKWSNTDKPILPIHRLRLEAMITVKNLP